jgi:hypothetical protein
MPQTANMPMSETLIKGMAECRTSLAGTRYVGKDGFIVALMLQKTTLRIKLKSALPCSA